MGMRKKKGRKLKVKEKGWRDSNKIKKVNKRKKVKIEKGKNSKMDRKKKKMQIGKTLQNSGKRKRC